MNYLMLVLVMVCLLYGGAWAISEPKCMLNESQVEPTKEAEILEDPFQNPKDDDYDIISLSWDEELQEAVTIVTWPFKYLTAKLKEGFNRFQSNMAVLRELHRRRKQNIHARLRRIRQSMPPPPLTLPRKSRPRSVRWIPEATLRAYLSGNLSIQALYNSLELDLIPWRDDYTLPEQHLLMPNGTIVAMR